MTFDWPQGRLAPLPFLTTSTLLMLLAIALATWYSLDTPWLGITAKATDHQHLTVTQVHPQGPLNQQLRAGDQLKAIVLSPDKQLDLAGYDPQFNPHAVPTYALYNRYMQRQGVLFDALAQPSVTLLTSHQTGDRLLVVQPGQERPLASLPLSFWLINLFGALACLISLSVWIFQPSQWPARLLALSGVSFFLATLQQSIWTARELALPTPTFELLMRGNHVFMHLLLITLMMLMIIYPRRLPHAKWLISGLAVFYVLQQINENLQLWSPPLHAFYLFLLMYYALGIYFAISQWRLSRYRPTDRGALRWVFLTILLAMGSGMLVYFLPTVLGLPPLGGLTTMVGIASTLYIGFALGILRYRLFQIERWWFVTWAWFLGGLSVLLIDLLVIFVFGIPSAYALSLSLLLVGWLYFPVRQWFWRRITSHRQLYMEHYLPNFVETLFTSPNDALNQHWIHALETAFQPLSIDANNDIITQPHLARNGASLQVPSFDHTIPSLKLLYAQKGKHLFNRRDLAMANALSSIASRICTLREARQQGAVEERKRIMRDLHDDVGGRLLTLIQTANSDNQETLARSALGALRETIYALDETSRYHLDDMLAEFRSNLHERLRHTPIKPELHLALAQQGVELSPRHFINLCRVLNEAVTNAIDYSAPGVFSTTIQLKHNRLHIEMTNPVTTRLSSPPTLFRGRGLSNIQTRIDELGGSTQIFCTPNPPSFCINIRVQLSTSI